MKRSEPSDFEAATNEAGTVNRKDTENARPEQVEPLTPGVDLRILQEAIYLRMIPALS